MNLYRGVFLKIIILVVFLNNFGFSQGITFNSPEKKYNFIVDWEYFNKDTIAIADSLYPSSGKTVELIYFKSDSFEVENLNNIIWFRKKIVLDPSFENKSVLLKISIQGACEIYINQKLIQTFGVVSANSETEELVSSDIQRVSYPFIPGKSYIVAIRYSNHSIKNSYSREGVNGFGVKVKLAESDNFFDGLLSSIITSLMFGLIISVFFFTLSFVHFVIFLFNKTEKSNLYYAFFCLTASTLGGTSILSSMGYYESIFKLFSLLSFISPAIIFLVLPYMIRSFFKLKFPKWYTVNLLIFLLLFILIIFFGDNYTNLYIFLITFSVIETIRSIIVAFIQKIQGVKIIGIGSSFFLIFVLVILIIIIFGLHANTNDETLGLTFLVLVLLSIFSIPVSITIFLSYQISLTNKSLKIKLIEVEDLSKQTIEQEKEKQKILLNQKSMLEDQVAERTFEITEQKKIIEEKNKDIIDSINYAKRIQTAILPEMNFFKSVFKDSFIIYHPRDIVSGDFYYVTEINNLKILFIADCTGHGVPGALMSMVGSNLIHKIIHENKILEPKEILQTLHIELRQALKQDQNDSQNRDGMDAAVVVLKGNELHYSGANRSLLYFNKTNELCEVKPTKTAVGGSHISKIEIVQHVLNCNEIKEFYLFSDGFADQFGGVNSSDKHAAGKKLMVSRFKNWLSETLNYTLNDKEVFLNTEFNKWKGNLEQVDDVCVICVRL